MTSPIQTPPPELGAILRRARKSRQLTLEQLAERSGVSKSMLSQIERGLVNPTFAVVWSLTQALGIEMSALENGDASRRERVVGSHEKAYETPVKTSADGKVRLRLLSPHRTILPAEWYDVLFEPGGELTSEPHAKGTYEHLSALSGSLRVTLSGEVFDLEEGDTIRYFADQPHLITNPDDASARALLLIALPRQYEG